MLHVGVKRDPTNFSTPRNAGQRDRMRTPTCDDDAARLPVRRSSVRRPGERKLTIAKLINSDDVSME